jgi:DNA polymerase III epsilon subunit-like protein
VVAHNLEFDKNVIIAELYRLEQPVDVLINYDKYFCTMQETVDLCGIKAISKVGNRLFIKFPTLFELYTHLFDETPGKLHNSLNDVFACARCFHMIKFNKDIFGELKRLHINVRLVDSDK